MTPLDFIQQLARHRGHPIRLRDDDYMGIECPGCSVMLIRFEPQIKEDVLQAWRLFDSMNLDSVSSCS